jgi:hypothetical protein
MTFFVKPTASWLRSSLTIASAETDLLPVLFSGD